MAKQHRYIVTPLSQWWRIDTNDVEPMKQVFAEAGFLDRAREILVGRRNDANIDLDRCLATDAIELALGQHPQQTRLQRRRHVADFIEKQRAAIGLFETPDAARVGARERASLVAKQLRLEQVGRDRRSVQCDERLACPRAVLMQRARDELLARP